MNASLIYSQVIQNIINDKTLTEEIKIRKIEQELSWPDEKINHTDVQLAIEKKLIRIVTFFLQKLTATEKFNIGNQLAPYLLSEWESLSPELSEIEEIRIWHTRAINAKNSNNLILLIDSFNCVDKQTGANPDYDDGIVTLFLIAAVNQAAPIIATANILHYAALRQRPKKGIRSFWASPIITEQWKIYKQKLSPLCLLIPPMVLKSDKITANSLGFDISNADIIETDEWMNQIVKDEKFNIDSLKSMFEAKKIDTSNKYWNIYLGGHGLTDKGISGMENADFKDFLRFLNSGLNTHLLFYYSCFGGGLNLINPYQDLLLNYIVVEAATTEAPAVNLDVARAQGLEELKYPLCERGSNPSYGGKKSHISFTRFFDAIEKHLSGLYTIPQRAEKLAQDPWAIILNYIQPEIPNVADTNTPLIRYPGTPFFKVAELGTSVITITEAKKHAYEIDHKEIVINANVKSLLWYPAINVIPLVFEGKQDKIDYNDLTEGIEKTSLVFMNPEWSLHFFDKIFSLKTNISDFCSRILWWKEWLNTSKIVVIKCLQLQDGQIHDCFFMLEEKRLSVYYCDNDDEFHKFSYPDQPETDGPANQHIDKAQYVTEIQELLNKYSAYKPLFSQNSQLFAPWQIKPETLVNFVRKEMKLPKELSVEAQEELKALEDRISGFFDIRRALDYGPAEIHKRSQIEHESLLKIKKFIKNRKRAAKKPATRFHKEIEELDSVGCPIM